MQWISVQGHNPTVDYPRNLNTPTEYEYTKPQKTVRVVSPVPEVEPSSVQPSYARVFSGRYKVPAIKEEFQVQGRHLNKPRNSSAKKKNSISGDLDLYHDQEQVWRQTPLSRFYENASVHTPEPRFDQMTVASDYQSRVLTPFSKTSSQLPPLSIISHVGSVIGDEDEKKYQRLTVDRNIFLAKKRRLHRRTKSTYTDDIRTRYSTDTTRLYPPGKPMTHLASCLNIERKYEMTGRMLGHHYPCAPNNSKENVSLRQKYKFYNVDCYLQFNRKHAYDVLPTIDCISGRSLNADSARKQLNIKIKPVTQKIAQTNEFVFRTRSQQRFYTNDSLESSLQVKSTDGLRPTSVNVLSVKDLEE